MPQAKTASHSSPAPKISRTSAWTKRRFGSASYSSTYRQHRKFSSRASNPVTS
jgi:hypothetical protein